MKFEILNVITNIVCETLGENTKEICSKTRTDRFVLVRNIIAKIAYENYGQTFTHIGRYLNRHHSTVLHGVSKLNSDMELYKGPQWEYQTALNKVLIKSNMELYKLNKGKQYDF